MVYELKKVIGPVPEDAMADAVFDRLNVEGNGKLSLVKFAGEVNALAIEKSASAIELKDFVYVVEWTGAICGGGGGAVLIDRFVATIRETQERRNMKTEFVTHYDSPQFVEGVQLLREEIKKCAKTMDGKLNYLIPFRLFDKNDSGQIVLSEFEIAIRELGVDRYLSDQEIKSLMRRFDPNSSGAIDYDEFLRFNLAESTSSSSSRKLCVSPSLGSEVRRILEDIIIHERLSSSSVAAFSSSLKRMFGIIDKETTGCVPSDRFVQTLREMDITIPKHEMEVVVAAFAGDGGGDDDDGSGGGGGTVQYQHFCDMLSEICSQENEIFTAGSGGTPPTELLDLLMNVHGEYHVAREKTASAGYADFDFHRAFGVEKGDTKTSLFLSADEFKEVLWAAGIRHPYLREELEAIITCFQIHARSGFNVAMFCKFLEKGPSALFHGNSGSLDVYITRLQDQLQAYLSSGKGAEERLLRLFAELDEDASGSLTRAEFVKLLQAAGFRHYLSPEDEQLLLRFLDANGDGSIVYSEFLEFATHADAKLNAIAGASGVVDSPPPSPPKAASPVKPEGSPSRDSPTTRKATLASSPPSPTAKQQAGKPSPHEALVYRIWRLNQKLRPEFPFGKYLNKYRSAENEVKTRVFEKVLDKFLAKLTACHVTYNMHEMDIELLTTSYGARDGASMINYAPFLKDLASAKTRAAAGDSDSDSSSSSSDDDELSCSSDEGDARSTRKQLALTSALSDAIKRTRPAQGDLELLRALVKGVANEWETKKRERVSENKIYKLLTKFAIRLRKKEVDLLLPALASEANGRKVYDSKRFFRLIDDVLAGVLGGNKVSSEREAGAAAAAASVSAPLPPPTLTPDLADKIYRCFLAAAQQNISGRKLLEKCDPDKTGTVSLLELQTVLRLMGCMLTEVELELIKKVLGNDRNSQLSYLVLVEQVSRYQQLQQQQRGKKSAKAAQSGSSGGVPAKPSRPPAILIPGPVMTPAPSSVAGSLVPSAFSASAASVVKPVVRQQTAAMSREETLRLDAFLSPFFVEILQSRNLTCDAVAQCFRAYDMKGTGFVRADAFASVMRKLDIWPPVGVSQSVLSRFASASGDKFDYVDFCHVVGRAQELASPRIKVASTPRDRRAGSTAPQQQQQLKRRLSFAKQVCARAVVTACSVQSNTRSSPATRQRPSLSLPSLEVDTSSVESAKAPSADAEWSCPVCFHTQTRATATCEICAAQNPASVAHELLLQCSACAFRNKPSAAACELCRLPLRPQPAKESSGAAGDTHHSSKKTTTHLKLPLHVPYDEGWLS